MDIYKRYLLIKKITSGNVGNEVVALASLKKAKFGIEISVKILERMERSFEIRVYNETELVSKTSELSFEIAFAKPNDVSIVICCDGRVKAFGGKISIFSALFGNDKIFLFEEDELELNDIISREMNGKGVQIAVQLTSNLERQSVISTITKPLIRCEKLAYFKRYKPLLEQIFRANPREKVLESMFACSRWVRAVSGGKIIVVGIIYEKNQPAFIGIGYPSMSAISEFIVDKRLGKLSRYLATNSRPFGYYLSIRRATNGKII